jgi:hypothetical protein
MRASSSSFVLLLRVLKSRKPTKPNLRARSKLTIQILVMGYAHNLRIEGLTPFGTHERRERA